MSYGESYAPSSASSRDLLSTTPAQHSYRSVSRRSHETAGRRVTFSLCSRDPALACAMPRRCNALLAVFLPIAIAHAGAAISPSSSPKLRTTRSSPLDLEIGGDLAGLPAGSKRYLTRDELLSLPQVVYTVSDDANLPGHTRVSGVSLEHLRKNLSASPESDMVVAICDDRYQANYPRDYIAAHHPLLALTINGQPPERWPKDSEGHALDLGPYLISHPQFTPSFKILSHSDEPQIPWGVVRLEFRDEKSVFGSIAPHGPNAQQQTVQAGYKIAQQNCFRCHNLGAEGGQKAARPWLVLSTWATASPDHFAVYVRNPKSKNPRAEMPGFPTYDDATIAALRAYFATFSEQEKQ
jgi:mono/diheme cytochrome c family protein